MEDLLAQAAILIKQHEGFKAFAYLDETGHWTIGYGRNLDANPLTVPEIKALFPNGITPEQGNILFETGENVTLEWLSKYSWWSKLSINRQICLLDMGFNLGEKSFAEFVHMIAALEVGNYVEAANQMELSKWFQQVGQRGKDDLALMQNG